VDPRPFVPPSDSQSFERIAAAILTTEEEYERITTPAVKGDGRALFFSGCNIYYQPNLLLTALDVLDLLVDDWTFLPGLDHCCGSTWDSSGLLDDGRRSFEELTQTMGRPGFKTTAVWCSTCAARLRYDGPDLPLVSFSRLIADHLGGRLDGNSVEGGITLHEPCKDAYLGIDNGQRDLLGIIAGEPVREMVRHGRDTVCCGWSLHQHRPLVWKEEFKERLGEARATGAGTLTTVCHGCQWIMDRPGNETGLRIVNYIRLVGEALGVNHRERFRDLRHMEDPEAAVGMLREEMGDRFDKLPFDPDRIRETVQILMEGFYST
jgi:Fe-S oxidoreductase